MTARTSSSSTSSASLSSSSTTPLLSRDALTKIQNASGLGIALFSTAHLANLFAGVGGALLYDEAQLLLRGAYHVPGASERRRWARAAQ